MLFLRKHSSAVQVQKTLKTYDLLENEGALWTGRTKEFMKKRADEDKDKKQRRLRVKTDTREQVPTYQWMQCVQTALRTAGLKFQDFAEIAVASEAERPASVHRPGKPADHSNEFLETLPPPRNPPLLRPDASPPK